MAINTETKIEFTIGWFLTTVGSVLSIFLAFYFVVQKPSNDDIKEDVKSHFEGQEKYLEEKFKGIDGNFERLSDSNRKIEILEKKISSLEKRDVELQKQKNQGNSGSFGVINY